MEGGRNETKSGMFTVNGAQRTELVIYMPGTKERYVINDSTNSSAQPLYTMGKKAGGILNNRIKFSSLMTKLREAHEEKMLIKQHEREEKKWKRQEEKERMKEEKHLSKEERKQLAAERRLKTNTLPQNFSFSPTNDTNLSGNDSSGKAGNMYRRSLLSFDKMPKICEDGDASVQPEDQQNKKSSQTKSSMDFLRGREPPSMDISNRTRSIFSGDPDLQRIEQIYGATLRGVPTDLSSSRSSNNSTINNMSSFNNNFIFDKKEKDIVLENLFANRDNFMPKKSQKKRAPPPPTQAGSLSQTSEVSSSPVPESSLLQSRSRSERQSFSAENAVINILEQAIGDEREVADHKVIHVTKDVKLNGEACPISITGGEVIEITHL